MATMGTAKPEQVACWSIPGYDHQIEIPLAVASEIVARAKEGFNRFPRGGLEVGGVLFGVRQEGRIQVRAVRPIPCKHTLGPSFTLAPEEHDELAALLIALKNDPELAGLVPVGWYHSHTRSGLLLTDADCHLHNRHFSQPWQIAVLVRPEAGRPAELGVFVRRPDEELSPRPALVVGEEAVFSVEAPQPDLGGEQPEFEETTVGGSARTGVRLARRAVFAAGLVVLAAIVLIGFREELRPVAVSLWDRAKQYWIGPAAPVAEKPFALSLASAGKDLLIRWNAAGGLASGQRVVLAISDGARRQEFPLDAETFARGEFRWKRSSERVVVTLSGRGSGGRALRESAYFLGPLPSEPPEPLRTGLISVLESEKAQLEIAVRRQKLDSDTLADRLVSLQAALKAKLAAAPAPAPEKPAVTLTQKSPEAGTAPVELIQRPEAAPIATAGPAASPSGAAPLAAQAGRLLWTGSLGPGRILTIQGRQASIGSLSGQLPGRPVRITVYPAELTSKGLIVYTSEPKHSGAGVTEASGPANAWTRTTYRYAPEKVALIQVVQAPGEANGWRAIWLRSSAPLSALVIDWEILP